MSRPGRYLRLLCKDPARRARWLQTYIHHRNLYAKGQAEFGGVLQVFNFQSGMIGWLFIKSIFPNIPLVFLGVGFVVAVVVRTLIKWLVGYLWDRYGLFDAETTWSNKRNPVAKAISKCLLEGKGMEG